MYKKTALLIISGIFLLCATASATADKIKLTINRHSFNLTIAKTPKQQEQGLMYRHQLPPRSGMLFFIVPEAKNTASMWMKNTTIPLDMLFVGPDLCIGYIVEHTKPLSLKPITCPHPTFVVIELNAGEAKKYHLTPGMKLGKK